VEDPDAAAAYYAELLGGSVSDGGVELGEQTRISFVEGNKGLVSVGLDLARSAADTLVWPLDHESSVADADGNRLEIRVCEHIDEQPLAVHRPTLGHLTFQSPAPLSQQRFYEGAGFQLSEGLGDVFRWMRCNPIHHTIAFSQGSRPGLHHIGIEVTDRAALVDACDRLAEVGQATEYGPGRHQVGGNLFVYFLDRYGFRIEFFCELARITTTDFVAPIHNAEARSQTINAWGPQPPESFRRSS
jgi:catechol 2,3-dioxygenase-like lactoylglutathione lyase family enzyme